MASKRFLHSNNIGRQNGQIMGDTKYMIKYYLTISPYKQIITHLLNYIFINIIFIIVSYYYYYYYCYSFFFFVCFKEFCKNSYHFTILYEKEEFRNSLFSLSFPSRNIHGDTAIAIWLAKPPLFRFNYINNYYLRKSTSLNIILLCFCSFVFCE